MTSETRTPAQQTWDAQQTDYSTIWGGSPVDRTVWKRAEEVAASVSALAETVAETRENMDALLGGSNAMLKSIELLTVSVNALQERVYYLEAITENLPERKPALESTAAAPEPVCAVCGHEQIHHIGFGAFCAANHCACRGYYSVPAEPEPSRRAAVDVDAVMDMVDNYQCSRSRARDLSEDGFDELANGHDKAADEYYSAIRALLEPHDAARLRETIAEAIVSSDVIARNGLSTDEGLPIADAVIRAIGGAR